MGNTRILTFEAWRHVEELSFRPRPAWLFHSWPLYAVHRCVEIEEIALTKEYRTEAVNAAILADC